MFPFNVEELYVKNLLLAVLSAHVQRQSSSNQIVPIALSDMALTALEDLMFLCLCRDEKGFYLSEMMSFTDYAPENKDICDHFRKKMLDRIMKNNAEPKTTEINAVLKKIESDKYRTSLLWANYFYSLTFEHKGVKCLRWLHSMLAIDGSSFYFYGDRTKLKKSIDYMTTEVVVENNNEKMFLARYDAALLSIEMDYCPEIRRV